MDLSDKVKSYLMENYLNEDATATTFKTKRAAVIYSIASGMVGGHDGSFYINGRKTYSFV